MLKDARGAPQATSDGLQAAKSSDWHHRRSWRSRTRWWCSALTTTSETALDPSFRWG